MEDIEGMALDSVPANADFIHALLQTKNLKTNYANVALRQLLTLSLSSLELATILVYACDNELTFDLFPIANILSSLQGDGGLEHLLAWIKLVGNLFCHQSVDSCMKLVPKVFLQVNSTLKSACNQDRCLLSREVTAKCFWALSNVIASPLLAE